MKQVYLTDEQHKIVISSMRLRSYRLRTFGPNAQRRADADYIDDITKLIEAADDVPLHHPGEDPNRDIMPEQCRHQQRGAACVHWCGNKECMK